MHPITVEQICYLNITGVKNKRIGNIKNVIIIHHTVWTTRILSFQKQEPTHFTKMKNKPLNQKNSTSRNIYTSVVVDKSALWLKHSSPEIKILHCPHGS